jgi:hypothetical protein
MSHPPSKEDLEAVWNSRPVGWLKDYNKNSRGKTAYTIVAKPYIKQYLDPIETTVFAKSAKKAIDECRWEINKKVREQYPYEENKDMSWEVGIK